MKIKVKIHTNSSREKIVKNGENEYEIWIKEKPIGNKANNHLVKILKEYFNKEVVKK